MHFHLPKPMHGWREFAGEVGIIVIGVLIALGAEQVVEIVRLESQTREARASVGAEVQVDDSVATERVAVRNCLNAQIDQLERDLLASGSVLTPARLQRDSVGAFVYRAPSRPWYDNVWQNMRSEDVFSNMSPYTRHLLSRFFAEVAYMQRMNDQEDNAVGAITVLGKPIPLDASVKSHLMETLETERRRNDLMGLISSQIMKDAATLGDGSTPALVRDLEAHSGTAVFCRSQDLPVTWPGAE